MLLLVLVSLIWAFSPGLTKGLVTGVDPAFVAFARLALAFLVFLPFFRWRGLHLRTAAVLFAIGAIQFGAMYLAYNESLRHLPSHEVALFTLTTPLFVTLLADALDRTFRPRALLAALIAVGGAVVIILKSPALSPTLLGVALVQLANLAFAIGQVWYRHLRRHAPAWTDRSAFALVYLGAATLPLIACFTHSVTVTLTGASLLTLLYLGVIASGIAFFLWNKGATHVSAGTLAVMNNAKIPLMVAASLLFFHESADWPRLLLGGALMAFAVWLAERRPSAQFA
ncbi:EamA family transporter [Horticoccus luteus]|uniref:EamA family transporter n=1 Tax=Horticoccus luteus TaxID=2862869 RepID=A0A8F9XMM1_9BACT|nr:EamA family transporter [Horticoccus luteus]QYM80184.1 EamA family transporter [Horticoccus luteus]